MCGIAGIWRVDRGDTGDRERIARMADVLRHRGPDDFGYLLAESAGSGIQAGQSLAAAFVPDLLLASRRLSITDLSPDGRQPISNEAGDIFVVFNGAIHNYVELRAELEARGHVFHSRTDTEVIVHAYEAWGEECARRFNGMWAYAIWDQRKRRLVLSRDRFGIKPLYVAWSGRTLYFASEMKAILAAGEVKATADLAGIARYIADGELDAARSTLFAGIMPVRAAHNVVISREGVREAPYWSYRDRSGNYDFAHPEETFRELLGDSVRLRLRADVPTAIMISGGLDSTAIAAMATRQGTRLAGFTAVFGSFAADESHYARVAAEAFGLPWERVDYRGEDLVANLSEVGWHVEAPSYHSQVLPLWPLLKAVGREHKVVLEGQGADELLAGYPRYLRPYVRDELSSLRPANARATVERLVAAARASRGAAFGPLPGWLPRRRANGAELAHERILGREPAGLLEAWRQGQPPAEGSPLRGRLATALWRDHSRAHLPELLKFGDAISMAHSVETRLPFLDHRLVEFGFGLPTDYKLRGRTTKYLLRTALAADFPPEILARREKVGFRTPLGRWMKRARTDIREVLDSAETRQRSLFSTPALLDLMDHGRPGDRRRTELLFRCLSAELWYRRFIDADSR